MLTPHEATDLLRVSPQHVYSPAAQGLILSVRAVPCGSNAPRFKNSSVPAEGPIRVDGGENLLRRSSKR